VLRAAHILENERDQRCERRLASWEIVACGTLIFLLLYFFDLLEVFIPGSTSLNRFVVFSATSTSVIIMVAKLPLTMRVLPFALPSSMLPVWLGVTTLWAAYPDLSRTRALSFAVSYFAALGLAIGFRSPRTLNTAFLAAFGSIIVADQVALAFETSYTEIGIRGIHLHKNAAGFGMSIGVVALAFALAQTRSAGVRFFAVVLAFAGLVLLGLTRSKTSLGLVLVALCLFPVYRLWVRGEGARLPDLIVTVVACTVVFAAGASGTKISKIGEVLFGDPTLTNRMAIWAAVEGKIAQSPWRGLGFGSFWDVAEEWNLFPAEGYVYYNDPEIINETHNGYLDLRLHGGYVALVLGWFVVLRALWFSLVLAKSRAVPVRHRWTFSMLHCLITIMMVQNLTESSLFFPGSHIGYFFLILLAQIERWKAEFNAQHAAHR
jgi:exopolysaccharide production protein ExoQ